MTKRYRPALLAAVPLLIVALAACNRGSSGKGIATAGGPQGGGASPSASPVPTDPAERARQFAACMRAEGIDIPDPEVVEGGGGAKSGIKIQAGGENVDKTKVNAAMEKCRKYLPEGGESRQLSPEELEQARRFAQCMRDNGISDFPDPDAEGGRFIRGQGGIDKNDAAFRAAMEKCNQNLPKPSGAPAVGGGGK